MARVKINTRPAVVRPRSEPRGYVRIETCFKVVTPVHGGGVAGDWRIDSITPIRGAGIRGQLRFWWRAVHARRYPTLTELHAAESELWGSAAGVGDGAAGEITHWLTSRPTKPNPWRLREAGTRRDRRTGAEELVWKTIQGRESIDYLAQALRPVDGSRPASRGDLSAPCLHTVPGKHSMALYCPNHGLQHVAMPSADLRRTLTAWQTFGSVGGRWRRGFGAVHGDHTSSKPIDFLAEVSQLGKHRHLLVPSLPSSQANLAWSNSSLHDPIRAWQTAADAFQAFRQGEGIGRRARHSESNRPGRSFWPEPDEIRALLNLTSVPEFKRRPAANRASTFARAIFGLPIKFEFFGDHTVEFRDGNGRTVRGKSILDDIELTPDDSAVAAIIRHERQRLPTSRLPSPVIIRPRLRGNQKWTPMAVVLDVPGLWDVDPQGSRGPLLANLSLRAGRQSFPVDGSVDIAAARKVQPVAQRRPANLGPQGDRDQSDGPPHVLAAFLNYLKST